MKIHFSQLTLLAFFVPLYFGTLSSTKSLNGKEKIQPSAICQNFKPRSKGLNFKGIITNNGVSKDLNFPRSSTLSFTVDGFCNGRSSAMKTYIKWQELFPHRKRQEQFPYRKRQERLTPIKRQELFPHRKRQELLSHIRRQEPFPHKKTQEFFPHRKRQERFPHGKRKEHFLNFIKRQEFFPHIERLRQ